MNEKAKRILSVFLAALFSCAALPAGAALPARALQEEPRKTPIMGWASWNAYRTDISEEIILSQAKKLKELGLADLGYVFVNVDDGWQKGRGKDGTVTVHPEKFPNGMKSLADLFHEMGLKAGIYTDAGASTCGWESDNQTDNDDVGLLGHEYEDLHRYLDEWGYDFVKVDWCGGRRKGLDAKSRYTMIGEVIRRIEEETGKDKIYNVCCWRFPGEWVVDVADSWRTGGDIFNNFGAVLEQLDNIKSLAKYNGPGHVNDLDMMQIGNGMSYEEDKSHFAMWCMMSTPLMLGMDLNSISPETLAIVSNEELIALDQDPACIQASAVRTYDGVEAWTKDLGSAGSGTKAFALLNRNATPTTVTISFTDLGLADVSSARDLWSHTDISTGDNFRVTVPAHGTVVLKASGTPVPVRGAQEIPDADDGSVVESSFVVAAKPATINLTAQGPDDWAHYGSEITHMKNGLGELALAYEGSFCTYTNAAARYVWTNGGETARSSGDSSGIGVLGDDAYMYVSIPCDGNERTLKVAVGSYSADMSIEWIVGGKVLGQQTVRGGNAAKADRLVTVTCRSDRPTTAFLRVKVIKNLGASQSVNIEGAALKIDVRENAIGSVEIEAQKGVLTVRAHVTADRDATLLLLAENDDGSPAALASADIKKGASISTLTADLPHDYAGTVSLYLWDGLTPLAPKSSFAVNLTMVNDYSVGMMTASHLLQKGAVLVDVRSAAEYEAGHIDGALHLDYSEVATKAESLLPDKNAKIIVYCSAAKRSAQALTALQKLGYTAVYNLGSMQNFYAKPMIHFSADTCRVITAGETVKVNFTADAYDAPEVFLSTGASSTLADAVPIGSYTVPEVDAYNLTLKAYLVYEGVCYAQTERSFLYWSEKTVDVFATDLPFTKATIGWGTIGTNRSVGGNPIRLAGKTFAHGIGTHANSEIEMKIPEGAKKFLAVAGCDEEMSGSYTMMFFVYVDGKPVDHSSLIKCGQHYVFDVDLPENAETILLYTFEGTYGGNTCDHGDWAVAGFVCDPGSL